MSAARTVVGTSVPRLDGPDKVTGRARYAVDLTLPGMLHAAVARSERAHAELEGIETAAALAVPGVVRVVTRDDVGGLHPYYGHIVSDHPILALDRVRFYGEPVALVLAETRAAALEAARLVRGRYRELPAVTDAVEALAEGAPVLHPVRGERVGDEGFDASAGELTGNLCGAAQAGWNAAGLEAAFQSADLVLEGEYRYPMLYGYAMEPYNALAAFDSAGLQVHTTAQHPYQVRSDLARIFGLPLAQVRVSVPYVGGGYGTKSYTKVEPLAAVGAHLAGRPVKLVLSVEEAILTTRSDSSLVNIRTAFAADGRILARDIEMTLNSGAYTDNSPLVAQKAANRAAGPYRIPALRVTARSVFTNTVPASSLRGFGAPLGNLAGESQLDEAAQKLGIDPVRLRLLNLTGRGEELIPGRRPLDADLATDLDLLAESLGWPGGAGGASIGFGLSASDAGAYPVSTALVRLHADGSASVYTGATELGQGSRTVLAQIAAEELGLALARVAVVSSDTGVGPYERTTGASRTTTIAGRALISACADARARVRELAAAAYGVDAAEVADAPGGVTVKDARRGYGEVIRAWFGADGEVSGTGAIRKAGDFAAMPPFWEVGVTGVALEVDEETGAIRVTKLATVADVGFAIHPEMLHGQDAGAAMMGLGAALREELVYDGEMLANGNVVDYRVPRFSDLPELDLMLAERGDGVGPYGAKGGGEGPTNPVGGAVASAVGRAIGCFPRQLPVTPERVWRLIKDRG